MSQTIIEGTRLDAVAEGNGVSANDAYVESRGNNPLMPAIVSMAELLALGAPAHR